MEHLKSFIGFWSIRIKKKRSRDRKVWTLFRPFFVGKGELVYA